MTKQVPTPPNEWLTRLQTEDEKDREFAKVLLLPAGAKQWDECTQEFWQQWQDEYNPQPEPETPVNENKEDGQ